MPSGPRLRDLLATGGAWCLHRSGMWRVHDRVARRGTVLAVFYHDVAAASPLPETQLFIARRHFEEHLQVLVERYDLIDLDALLAGAAPATPACFLSFDGCAASFLDVGRHIGGRGGRATFYLITGPILEGRPHWRLRWYAVCRGARGRTFDLELPDGALRLDLPTDAGAALQVARQAAARLAVTPEPGAVVERLAARAGVDLAAFDRAHRPLRPDEVRALAELPGISLGSHSHTHPGPGGLAPGVARLELARSRALLEGWSGRPVRHFAYPDGEPGALTPALLREAGYSTAAGCGAGRHTLRSPDEWPWRIPRLGVGDGPFWRLAGQLAGIDRAAEHLRAGAAALRHRG